jgi:hypothetical protein
MKKIKNICLAVFIVYALGGTTFNNGSQRFMNLARYATAAATAQRVTLGTKISATQKSYCTVCASLKSTLPYAFPSSASFKQLEKIFISYNIPGINVHDLRTVEKEKEVLSLLQKFEERKTFQPISDNIAALVINTGYLLPKAQREKNALAFLCSQFDEIDLSSFTFLTRQLSSTNDKITLLSQLANEKKLNALKKQSYISYASFSELLNSLPPTDQAILAQKFLKYFDILATGQGIFILPFLIEQLSSEEQTVSYRNRFLNKVKTKKIESYEIKALITSLFHHLPLEKKPLWAGLLLKEVFSVIKNDEALSQIFEFLPVSEKEKIAQLLLEKDWDQIPPYKVALLISFLPPETKPFWFKKLQKIEPLFSLFTTKKTATGPLFSDFVMNHASLYLCYNKYDLTNDLQETFDRVAKFTAEEYEKGNIVLFNSQHSQWTFLEKLFKALLFLKYGTVTPDDFVWLRFYKQFSKWRSKEYLYANLHPGSNAGNTNSLHIFIKNQDLTISYNAPIDAKRLEEIFSELDMKEEYELLRVADPEIFTQLYKLYSNEVKAQGGHGRLIAISLPSDFARKSCQYYAEKKSCPLINGAPTTDVVTIANHFNQVDIVNEYWLDLSEPFYDPAKAAEMGIRIKGFTTQQNPASVPIHAEVEAEFAKVLDRVAELHKKRIAREGKS